MSANRSLADTLTKQVTGILAARGKAEGRLESIVEIVPDGRSNQLIVIGSAAAIQDTKAIIKQFDVPLGLTTKAYSFEHVSANRIDSLMLDLLGEETSERLYRSSVDDEENLLIVTTTKDIHQQIEQIKKSRDIRPKRGRSRTTGGTSPAEGNGGTPEAVTLWMSLLAGVLIPMH